MHSSELPFLGSSSPQGNQHAYNQASMYEDYRRRPSTDWDRASQTSDAQISGGPLQHIFVLLVAPHSMCRRCLSQLHQARARVQV